uniref:Uncharacterized protein n=1 Tax=Sphaerodactylus townsendi TaxID=933632 RepID=A0ACB8EWG8_9SAUR
MQIFPEVHSYLNIVISCSSKVWLYLFLSPKRRTEREGKEMELIEIFLILLSFAPGSFSSPRLTQYGPAMLKPGGSFKVTCVVSGVQVSAHYWFWARQLPREREARESARDTSRDNCKCMEPPVAMHPAFSTRITK